MDERRWGYVRPLTEEDRGQIEQVDPDRIYESLHYALAFNERGKPRGPQIRADLNLTAIWLVQHLLRSGYVIARRPLPTPGG